MTAVDHPLRRIALALTALAMIAFAPSAASAQEKVQLFVTAEDGFGRLVIDLPDRLDLLPYKVRSENGVLSVEFEQPMKFVLPDVAVTLPDYISIARVDPDKKGVRFGLRTNFNFHTLEAGEKLFIDLLPPSWQGLPPGLPPSVVTELTERAKDAAIRAEQKRKADDAQTIKPVATLRVGRNPTFMRIAFEWSAKTESKFSIGEDGVAHLDFDWPVPVDLYALKSDLPAELTSVENAVDADGTHIAFQFADGIVPRYYKTSPNQVIVDIDINAAEQAAEPDQILGAEIPHALLATPASPMAEGAAPQPASAEPIPQTSVEPRVSAIANTVRIVFPFDHDTAAAAFQRGDTLWLLFDTPTVILTPTDSLSKFATGFTILPTGDTQIVRVDLNSDLLPTMSLQGSSWILSLGDVLLDAIEPLPLNRRRDDAGQYEMVADLVRPGLIHDFRDPVAGDTLTVVTAFGPVRGTTRTLDYVDLAALRTLHGLVIKPQHDDVAVTIDATSAIITTPGGLSLSAPEQARAVVAATAPEHREGYIDLATQQAPDPIAFGHTREELISKAAESEGAVRDAARLQLAQFYLANQFSYEAIGVLKVMQADLKTDDLKRVARLSSAIADILSYRPREALDILNAPAYGDQPDAQVWRTMARSDAGDYNNARLDAMASEPVLESYPRWVREKFLFAAIRAGVETNDFTLAKHFLGMLDFSKLEPEEVTWYQLFSARVAESEGRRDEALDGYGQVIAADVRPTRAEAVYRTVLLLDKSGDIDLQKATTTLQGEAMLWRGDTLEGDMQSLLARLYFRHKDYRLGFETVKQAIAYHPETANTDGIVKEAEGTFEQLYLNGVADALQPVDALSLFYDFRELTPPGARGDEMIRNLARRLVKVDLLGQAADLLEYQIDDRLKGVAQAQVAAELAVIRIADRDPESALRVLNRTRLTDLSPTLERQRRILEARAMIDAGRQELALDLLRNLTGRDADLLRIDGLWKSQRYVDASELIEVMYSDDTEELMNQSVRLNVIKAAVGMVLGGDRLGLQRIRSKFGERMAQSAEWPVFDFITGEVAAQSVEFRKVAREVSGIDSLNAFLAAYRQIYGSADSTAPAKASPPKGA